MRTRTKFRSVKDMGEYALFSSTTLVQRMGMLRLQAICKAQGHDIRHTGHCGPDTGSMGAICVRCGADWETTLY